VKRIFDMPFGAACEGAGARFRLWAPGARTVELRLRRGGRERVERMRPAGEGFVQCVLDEARPGDLYGFRIDGRITVPDPAARFQPEGVHGLSELIDPGAYEWRDGGWRGRPWEEAVVYELHVGAFSRSGRYSGIEARLDHLAELGITAIELMPVAECPGARNWGYDGVLPFAPESGYGRPEELKRLVDAAHARGLMVLLDVVYNHFGPEGNYLHVYAPQFFDESRHTPWGAAVNFDREGSRQVRAFFIANALYWLTEYNMDGLRLDAVHAILDTSSPSFLEELATSVRTRCSDRRRHLVLENDRNEARLLAREGDGRARLFDAQWNDDCHHAMHVLLTDERGGYYADYGPEAPRHLVRTLAEGFAWQGEPSPFRKDTPRGEPSGCLPPAAFVNFLQNHDQIGNRAFGERLSLLCAREAAEAAIAVLLLAPHPPMLFMGEEWAAPEPFPFFCDFSGDMADQVREGRRREFAHLPEFADPELRERIPDPTAESTFRRAVLNWECRDRPVHRAAGSLPAAPRFAPARGRAAALRHVRGRLHRRAGGGAALPSALAARRRRGAVARRQSRC
jgi:maltooligosyltrehalose trehalohydrolase